MKIEIKLETKKIPRIIIAGTNSGCGKTTITCALLQLLTDNKISTASFKCGPDYIDSMFHEKIMNIKSSNLDSFFCDENTIKYLLAKNAKDAKISVIEGVMGYYDGCGINHTQASTYELSQIINSPVILCINCSGMANSALAVLKGFRDFNKNSNIKGVIFNNMSKASYETIKDMVDDDIKPLGYLPKLPNELILKSRHLGLITADEIIDVKDKLKKLTQIATDTLDLDGIMSIASLANDITYEPICINKVIKTNAKESVKIGVAYDNAFCFYYRDNLELLEELGAQIVYFSPLHDKKLPIVDGIYLGGGYPQLYENALSQNSSMQASIENAIKQKIPCIAECGGFMYIAHLLGGECFNTGKLTRFGYVTLKAQRDNMLCNNGDEIRGHEFHYFDCTNNGDAFIAKKLSGKSYPCVIANENLYAGFPHLHFYSNIKFAENFIKICAKR